MDKTKAFVEFYIWLLDRERSRLIQHYKNNAFDAFRPDHLPEDRILNREEYQARLDNALAYHHINKERVVILEHQIAMMKSVLEQIDNPTDDYTLNHYYGLYEADKLGLEAPDFDYHNREYDNG